MMELWIFEAYCDAFSFVVWRGKGGRPLEWGSRRNPFIERLAALKIIYLYTDTNKKYKKNVGCRRRSVQCIFLITGDKGLISNEVEEWAVPAGPSAPTQGSPTITTLPGEGDTWPCSCPLLNAVRRREAAWRRANGGRCEGQREGGVPEALPSPEYLRRPRRGDPADLPEPCGTPGETSGAMRYTTSPPLPPLLPWAPGV